MPNLSINVGGIGNGYGEAQIFHGNKGLDILLQREQQRQRNQALRLHQDQWLARQKHERDRELMKMDFNKPGIFQQDESMRDIANFRKKTYDMALRNPSASALDIKQAMADEEAEAKDNIAKREIIQKLLDEQKQEYLKDSGKFDKNALVNLKADLIYQSDENGNLGNRHVKNIDPEAIREINSHPSVWNNNALVIDKLAPIKSQMTYTPNGTVVDTPFGQLEKTEQHGVRFKNIGETTNYVLHSDPRIENKAYWEVAQDQVRANGENPENILRVQQVYDQIRNDPKFNSSVYEKVEPIVKQLQQEVNKRYTKSIGTYSTAQKEGFNPTDDHYKTTNDQMESLVSKSGQTKTNLSLGPLKLGSVKSENPEFLKSRVPVPSDNKWDGKEIEKASPAYKNGKPVIRLVLKEGTKTDIMGNKQPFTTVHDIPVDMNNPEYFNYMKHNHGEKISKLMNENAYLKWKQKNTNFDNTETKGAFDEF
jgi:hypothetical protein